MPLSATDLATLSHLLEQGMDLPEAEREPWLAALPKEHERLLPPLRDMFAARSRTAGLLASCLPGLDAQDDADEFIAAGEIVGPYRILRAIGRGGMGSVWLAERADGSFQRQVALKLPRIAWGGGLVRRMAREREIGARLEHPGIARLYDAGVDARRGWPYLAFEYVDGACIDEWCRDKALDARARVELLVPVARAVAYAHARLVVHRDLKPSNVMVSQDGSVRLLDFGIAKLVHENAAQVDDDGLTRTLGHPLTLAYASPEQVRGEALTVASDVYGLGVLAYELLTGTRPFQARRDTAGALQEAILQGDPPPASQRVPAALAKALRGDLDAVLSKALRLQPQERYASADALADDLQRHLDHVPVRARPASTLYHARKFVRRHRRGVAATAAVTTVALLAGGQVLSHRRQSEISLAQSLTANELLQHVFSGMSPDASGDIRFSARELLERAQQYLEVNGAAQEDVRERARWRMAELFEEVGAFDNAAGIYRQAEEKARARGDEALATEALLMLADIELRAGRSDASLDALNRMASSARRQPVVLARVLTLTGELHIEAGRNRAAIEALEGAQRALDTAGSQDALLHARAAQVLATALRRDVQLERAREQLLAALRWQGQRSPPSPVDRLLVEKDLGGLDSWLGHYDAAEGTLVRVQRELLARVGPLRDHTVTAGTELAWVYLRSGQLDKAKALAGEALAQLRPHAHLHGSAEYMAAILARVRMYEGDHAGAVADLHERLAQALRDKADVHTGSEPLRRALGEALLRAGQTAAAVQVLRQTEANQIRLTSADHASVATTRIVLATALARQGQLAEAQHLWRQARVVLAKHYAPEHPFVIACDAYVSLQAGVTDDERRTVATRLRRRLGWQPGADELARWLDSGGGDGRSWAHLPVVL